MEEQFALSGWRLSETSAKQKREPVSLLHLPDELLLQVIEDLSQTDLYALSVQCMRLQRLTLPSYLLSYGITTPLVFPIDHLVIAPEHLSVPGISLAFFGKNVRRFSSGIGRVQSPSASALYRLFGIVVNLKGLEDLALDFGDWCFIPFVSEDQTAQAFINMLEVVVERCHCLKLSGSVVSSYFSNLVEEEATKWRGRPLKRPLEPLGDSRSQSSHVLESYPHRSCTLKTFIFQSNMFLLPPFSGWAFKALNTAPLTRLDLIEVDLLGYVAFIFEALTIPTLEHLRVISCEFGLNFDALPEFLARHSTISTFEIIPLSTYTYQLPMPTLPALISLKSNLSNIDSLLTPPGAFPKLIHVRAVSHLSQFIFADLENSLAQAARRLTMPNIQLCLEVLPASRYETSVSLGPVPQDIRMFPVLCSVREIVFGFPHLDVLPTTTIPTWLSKFPILEEIEIIGMPIGLDYQVKMSFLRRIAEECTGIRAVKIGDDTRRISVWLSSDH